MMVEASKVVKEADGFQLHLSRKSGTGYLGVSLIRQHGRRSRTNSSGYMGVFPHGGRFRARHASGGKLTCIGNYSTAVEAAVAIAKHVASAGQEQESDGVEAEEENEAEAQDDAEADEEMGEEMEEAVNEAEGVKLHLSQRSSTGYLGVVPYRGRFKAQHTSGGKVIYIGVFATAVEAAMAVAKHITSAGGAEPENEDA